MPPKKKRKTHHRVANDTSQGGLSHDEIWDDSALLRSWNDALAEYEYYHSIHARGEDVEEVLARAEAEEAGEVSDKSDGAGDVEDEGVEEGEIDDDEKKDQSREDGEVDLDGLVESVETAAGAQHEGGGRRGKGGAKQIGPEPPPTTDEKTFPPVVQVRSSPPLMRVEDSFGEGAGQVAAPKNVETSAAVDHTLENLKMAYYWAGYYSGLYDGQRQAQGQAGGEGG